VTAGEKKFITELSDHMYNYCCLAEISRIQARFLQMEHNKQEARNKSLVARKPSERFGGNHDGKNKEKN